MRSLQDSNIITALDEVEIELRNQGLCTALIYSLDVSGLIEVDILRAPKPVIHCKLSLPALVELAVSKDLTLRNTLLTIFRSELIGDSV